MSIIDWPSVAGFGKTPKAAFRDENIVALANLEVKSCSVGIMYRSLSTLRLRRFRSTQIHSAPDFFKTDTKHTKGPGL